MREGYFLYNGVRPQGPEKFLFLDEPPLVLDQQYQRIEDLRGEWHHFTVTQESLLGRHQGELTEFVRGLGIGGHRGSFLGFYSIPVKFSSGNFKVLSRFPARNRLNLFRTGSLPLDNPRR
jgi:hypothetical protein